MTSIADRICLITPLDRNKTVVDEFGKTQARYYEDEAVRLVKYWRRRGGDLAGIPIYAYEFQERKIQERTRESRFRLWVPEWVCHRLEFILTNYFRSME